MATCTRGQTFGATETVTNTKLHNLVDLATISGIVNAEIDASAAIVDTKLAQITTPAKVANSALVQITTAEKVKGTALIELDTIPAGAGQIPIANLEDVDVVDSLHAAATATADKLLALDANSEFDVLLKSFRGEGKSYTTEETTTSSSYVDCTGGSDTLILRQTSLVTFVASADVAGKTGPEPSYPKYTGYVHLIIDGTEIFEFSKAGAGYSSEKDYKMLSLVAGTYTIKWQKKTSVSGQTAYSKNKYWSAMVVPD